MVEILEAAYCMRCHDAMPTVGGRRCPATDLREACIPEPRRPRFYKGALR